MKTTSDLSIDSELKLPQLSNGFSENGEQSKLMEEIRRV